MRIEAHVRIQDDELYGIRGGGGGREDRFSAWEDCGEVRDGGKRVGYGGVGWKACEEAEEEEEVGGGEDEE